jgi:4-amino-4-deoxy-L-arabinose transferase-like glycosyltransferase
MRNAALIAVSIVAVLPPASRVLHAYDAFLIAIATLTFALLYISAETAMTNGAYGRGAHP